MSCGESSGAQRTTVLDLRRKYAEGVPITAVTAYDSVSGMLVDESGVVDLVLVGDSLGMVVLGRCCTTSVTMEEMIHHCKAVMSNCKYPFVIGDMPFGSYEVSPKVACMNALRLVKEGGVNAVKLEGGTRILPSVRSIVNAGILVCGHIGLTPQTTDNLGGFKAQGKTFEEAQNLLKCALELQEAGVFMIVMEAVPEKVSSYITSKLSVPTIGIGSGNMTSGQILVWHDMMGLNRRHVPKFAKVYVDSGDNIVLALKSYAEEVRSRTFPNKQHSFLIKTNEYKKFLELSEKNYSRAHDDAISPSTSAVRPKADETCTSSVPVVDTIHGVSNGLSPPNSFTGGTVVPTRDHAPDSSSQKFRNIVVIGGGSMGSLFCAKLAKSSPNSIWLISSWQEHTHKINKFGLFFESLDGNIQRITNIRATSNPQEVVDSVGHADLVIILTKSYDTLRAAEQSLLLTGGVEGNGIVLTFQNGVGNFETLEKVFNGCHGRVFNGLAMTGAVSTSGAVFERGNGNAVIIVPDSLDFGNGRTPPLDGLIELFNSSGINTTVSSGPRMIWTKLIINCVVNPITALLRIPNGKLMEDAKIRATMGYITKECLQVAKAKGIELPYDSFEDSLFQIIRETGENESSMLKDVLRCQQTEIDWINGAIINEAKKHGISVPYNQKLYDILSDYRNLPPPERVMDLIGSQ